MQSNYSYVPRQHYYGPYGKIKSNQTVKNEFKISLWSYFVDQSDFDVFIFYLIKENSTKVKMEPIFELTLNIAENFKPKYSNICSRLQPNLWNSQFLLDVCYKFTSLINRILRVQCDLHETLAHFN